MIDLSTLTTEQVVALRDKALELILEGKTLMSWGESGSSGSKQFAVPPVDLLNAASAELRARDPETYVVRVPKRVGVSIIRNIDK